MIAIYHNEDAFTVERATALQSVKCITALSFVAP